MDIKSYADILKFAIQTQINYKNEEQEEKLLELTDEQSRFLDGVIAGLYIALDVIDASIFLAEK